MVVCRSFIRKFADGDLGKVDVARRVLCVGMIEVFGVRLWLFSLEHHVEAGCAIPDSERELLGGPSVSRTDLSGARSHFTTYQVLRFVCTRRTIGKRDAEFHCLGSDIWESQVTIRCDTAQTYRNQTRIS
jgi:hypothetical protein